MANIDELIKQAEQHVAELKQLKVEQETKTEKKEFKYPIYCKHEKSSLVVKFDGLESGVVVVNNDMYNVGECGSSWVAHTDTSQWEQLEVDEETGFFDGQAIFCWDNVWTHQRILKFWDAKNKCPFNHKGERDGSIFNNYAPFEGNYTEWMLEAFKTLKR